MKLLFIFGTRPELIKLAPIIKLCERYGIIAECFSTGQHAEMLSDVVDFFDIKINHDLKVMRQNQNLNALGARILHNLAPLIEACDPEYVVVHGDTSTTLYGAISAFYAKKPVLYVESGLRSHSMTEPFPEEANRVLTSRIAALNFAPTEIAAQNLIKEGIESKKIIVTGNTIVDAVKLAVQISSVNNENFQSRKDNNQILITMHRRENIPNGLKNLIDAINQLVSSFPDISILFPAHKNPKIRMLLETNLKKSKRIKVTEPLRYDDLVREMEESWLLLTDSGGLQEEAPSFNLPVLVLRNTTERPEGIDCGVAKLIGTDKNNIISEVTKLIKYKKVYDRMKTENNPYGDGYAADRILRYLIANKK